MNEVGFYFDQLDLAIAGFVGIGPSQRHEFVGRVQFGRRQALATDPINRQRRRLAPEETEGQQNQRYPHSIPSAGEKC